MQICSVSVEGFRCLADVAGVPVLSQTILTGQNEGGKTALLDALNFLLHGTALIEHDLTYVGDGDLQELAGHAAAPHARVPQTVVTGSFSLSTEEQLRLELPEQVRIRRRFRPEAGMFLEVHSRVCQDPQLRDLAAVKLPGLKELAAAHGVEPVGQANAKGCPVTAGHGVGQVRKLRSCRVRGDGLAHSTKQPGCPSRKSRPPSCWSPWHSRYHGSPGAGSGTSEPSGRVNDGEQGECLAG